MGPARWYDRTTRRLVSGAELIEIGNARPQTLASVEDILTPDRQAFVQFLILTDQAQQADRLVELAGTLVEQSPKLVDPDALDTARFGFWHEFEAGVPVCLGRIIFATSFEPLVAYPGMRAHSMQFTLAVASSRSLELIEQAFERIRNNEIIGFASNYKRSSHWRFGQTQLDLASTSIGEVGPVEFDHKRGPTIKIGLHFDFLASLRISNAAVPDYEVCR